MPPPGKIGLLDNYISNLGETIVYSRSDILPTQNCFLLNYLHVKTTIPITYTAISV